MGARRSKKVSPLFVFLRYTPFYFFSFESSPLRFCCALRLGEATVLILGLRGITAEVIKNIALAGVKSIVIVDEGNLTEADLHSNLFATYDKLGQVL